MALPRPFWTILALSLALRAGFAALLPLGTDEAYALAVGRSFSISFFDHPPLGFWAPAAMEALFSSNAPLLLRLPSLIFGTATLWGFYLCGNALGGARTGQWTMGLAALSPMVAFSGLMILPDAPLNLWLVFTAYALIRLAKGADGCAYWALGGGALAVALASKYQAGLLAIALLIWMASSQIGRGWFLRRGFYLALALSLIGLAPVVIWNLQHDWASFAFHAGRAGGGLNGANFAKMALGQAAYLLPPVLIWAVMALADRSLWADPVQRILAMIGLAPVLVFNAVYAVSDNSLAHWTMAGWIMFLPLIALRIDRARAAKIWVLASAAPLYLAGAAVALHVATGVFAAKLNSSWDNTAPLIPMGQTRAAVLGSGVLAGADFIAAKDWIEAGHIAAALGPSPAMRVLPGAPHHFAFMPAPRGKGVLLVLATEQTAAAVQAQAQALAKQIDPAATGAQIIHVPRGGRDYFAIIAIKLALP